MCRVRLEGRDAAKARKKDSDNRDSEPTLCINAIYGSAAHFLLFIILAFEF